MLRGELPTREQADLLEAALVPGVDHGPHAPSIAISRMAVTCGLPVNGAMASAVNVLDDIHGGAGQQCMERYREIDVEAGPDGDLVVAAPAVSSATGRPARRSCRASATASTRSTRASAPLFALRGEGGGERRRSRPLRAHRARRRGGAQRQKAAATSR